MFDEFKVEPVTNERKRLHCVNCKRSTIHLLETRCSGSWNDAINNEGGAERYSIFRCGACDNVCYETASSSSYDVAQDENGEYYNPEATVQYPTPMSAHFNFNTDSTPRRLDVILDEMLYALAGSKMILATIGLRLSVEFIVNDKKCKGKNLYAKINDLHAQKLIDDDQKELLQRIRDRGNAGAHEANSMDTREIIAGMSIIEGLLEKLYNGPERHASTIRKAKRLLKLDDADDV